MAKPAPSCCCPRSRSRCPATYCALLASTNTLTPCDSTTLSSSAAASSQPSSSGHPRAAAADDTDAQTPLGLALFEPKLRRSSSRPFRSMSPLQPPWYLPRGSSLSSIDGASVPSVSISDPPRRRVRALRGRASGSSLQGRIGSSVAIAERGVRHLAGRACMRSAGRSVAMASQSGVSTGPCREHARRGRPWSRELLGEDAAQPEQAVLEAV